MAQINTGFNPYIGGNLQAINQFIKRDSELAAFYKQEAEPVSLPLFGPESQFDC